MTRDSQTRMKNCLCKKNNGFCVMDLGREFKYKKIFLLKCTISTSLQKYH